MFTGIIQYVGRVESVEPAPAGVRLVIDTTGWDHRAKPGESICVNGCCLTHEAIDGRSDRFAFHVVHETLRKTTLGFLKPGDRVNLESSLTPLSRMGGHFVQGHVDGVARVEKIEKQGGEHLVTLSVEPRLMRFIPPTGSVALDGVSLTVARCELRENIFTVALIPTTLTQTTLGAWKPGDAVNLETDLLVRAVVHAGESSLNPRPNPPSA